MGKWVGGWVSEWVGGWVSEWVGGWVSEWVGGCVASKCMSFEVLESCMLFEA